MNNLSETVQNGTNMAHDSYASMSDIEQGLGQIRVLENENNIIVTHYVSARERFFSEYSKFAVKTAQSTVEMCRVIFEAKKSLEKSEYIRFLKDVGHKSEDATIRKYLAIGERYDDLIACTNLLPSSWTSIYKITQIPAESFMAMVATGNSMANLTGAQIKILVDISKPPPSTDSACVAPTNSVATTQTVPTNSVQSSSDDDKRDESLTPSNIEQTSAEYVYRDLVIYNEHLDVVSTDDTYEVLVRFNSKPSDQFWWDLTEAIEDVVEEKELDVEIIQTRPLYKLV